MIYRFGEFETEVAREKDSDIGVVFVEDLTNIEQIIGQLLSVKARSMPRC